MECILTFEKYDLYYGIDWHKHLNAPTNHCFALKDPQVQKKSSKYIKYICCENEYDLKLWFNGIRIAKYGDQLQINYTKIRKLVETFGLSGRIPDVNYRRLSTPQTQHHHQKQQQQNGRANSTLSNSIESNHLARCRTVHEAVEVVESKVNAEVLYSSCDDKIYDCKITIDGDVPKAQNIYAKLEDTSKIESEALKSDLVIINNDSNGHNAENDEPLYPPPPPPPPPPLITIEPDQHSNSSTSSSFSSSLALSSCENYSSNHKKQEEEEEEEDNYLKYQNLSAILEKNKLIKSFESILPPTNTVSVNLKSNQENVKTNMGWTSMEAEMNTLMRRKKPTLPKRVLETETIDCSSIQTSNSVILTMNPQKTSEIKAQFLINSNTSSSQLHSTRNEQSYKSLTLTTQHSSKFDNNISIKLPPPPTSPPVVAPKPNIKDLNRFQQYKRNIYNNTNHNETRDVNSLDKNNFDRIIKPLPMVNDKAPILNRNKYIKQKHQQPALMDELNIILARQRKKIEDADKKKQ
jgi:hypothetical protein